MDDDLTNLCRSCGLCCDGSLFGRVGLQRQELERARRNRLHVLESGKSFEQPCSALREPEGRIDGHRACSVYDERPLSCRSFACRLYDRHRREGGPLEPRLAAVRRVRALLAAVESLRLKTADIDGDRTTGRRGALGLPETETWLELMRRLEEDFARA